MAGRDIERSANGQIIVKLVGFLVDLGTLGRIELGNAAIQDILELSLYIIGQALASAISTGRVRLVPVVRVVDVFQPATSHDRELLSALCTQVGSPRQTQGLEAEELIDGSQVASQDFSHGLASAVALVVRHLDTETA